MDGDGDLDLVAGNYNQPNRVYRNNSAVANTLPSAPGGLNTLVSGPGPYDVMFSWSPATDAETLQAGLTYNLRVGTSPGASDVMSGMSDAATGLREVPAMGNVQHNTSWTLTLPAGTYYWSVQAVDASFAGSAWAGEQTAVVGAAPLFVEGFEDGNYNGWVAGTAPVSRIVTSATAAGGTYSFTMDGVCTYEGLSRAFADLTPSRVSFYVRKSSNTVNGGTLLIRAGSGLLYEVANFYLDGSGTMGLANSARVPYVALQWYHVELMINWGARNIDLYVDGSLVDSDVPIRGSRGTEISVIEFYNNGSVQAWWDEIVMDP
jgi:hypothetical protein